MNGFPSDNKYDAQQEHTLAAEQVAQEDGEYGTGEAANVPDGDRDALELDNRQARPVTDDVDSREPLAKGLDREKTSDITLTVAKCPRYDQRELKPRKVKANIKRRPVVTVMATANARPLRPMYFLAIPG